MFDYEKSRPTLRHFTKGEMAHSPESLSFIRCVPFWWLCFQFCTSVWCKCLVVCSKCLVVCTQWMVCVCHLKIWLCVPNENRSSILWTVKRFDGKESSCKGSVRFSILCVRFSVFCVQFWESRYYFWKTFVNNCKFTCEMKCLWWGPVTVHMRMLSVNNTVVSCMGRKSRVLKKVPCSLFIPTRTWHNIHANTEQSIISRFIPCNLTFFLLVSSCNYFKFHNSNYFYWC